MSFPSSCVPSCCPPVIQNTQIPGPQGLPGTPCTPCTNGVDAFTITTADFVVPVTGNNVLVTVGNSIFLVVGQNVMIGQGAGAALANPGPMNGQVVSLPSTLSIQVKALGYPGDVIAGTTISSGAVVSVAGQQQASPIGIADGGTGQITAAAAAKALTARYRMLGSIIGANFNSTADQAMSGMPSKYVVRRIMITNASVDLSAGTIPLGGFYTAPAKGGTAVVAAGQSYAALTASTKWMDATIAAAALSGTDALVAATFYLSLSTAHAAPATCDVYVFGEDLSS